MPTAYDTWLEGDCGVDDAADLLAEAREEYIADHAPAIAEKLVGSPDFCEHVFHRELDDDAQEWVRCIAARFVEAMENARDTEADIAAVAVRYWRELRQYALPEALVQAKQEAGEAFDKEQTADDMPRSEAEYRRELAA
jgi:hypothetical protein